jgi:putative endonuclease
LFWLQQLMFSKERIINNRCALRCNRICDRQNNKLLSHPFKTCPDGGIGRRAGLKHQCLHWHAGSTPARGTYRSRFNPAFFFKMACVYILYSETADKFYIGCTKDLQQRFEYHILREFPSSFTAKYSDWKLFFELPDLSITKARKIETHIKRMKSRSYLENMKKYPELSARLIQKYR